MSHSNPNDSDFSPELAEKSRMTDDALLEAHTRTFSKSESEGNGVLSIPILGTALFTLIFVFGGIYLNKYTGGYHPFVFDPEGSPPSWGPVPEGGQQVAIDGEKLYKRNCIACHQADGKGLPGAFPPIVGSRWVRGEPDRMVAIILNGLTGPIEVTGKTYNSIMTPFSSLLDDEQIAAIATFVRSNPDWGNNADRVSAEQVTAIRASHERPTAWSVEEIKELFPFE